MLANVRIYSNFFIILSFISYFQQISCQQNKLEVVCEKYLNCRRELEEKIWNCSNKARKGSQYACKSQLLIEEFYDSVIAKGKFLTKCHLAKKSIIRKTKVCNVEKTEWPAFDNCSSIVSHQAVCMKLRDCCPEINKCTHTASFKLLSKKMKDKKDIVLKQLYKCSNDMEKVVSANMSRDDTDIAVNVMDSNEIVIAMVVEVGHIAKKKSMSKHMKKTMTLKTPPRLERGDSLDKIFGTPLLNGSSYVQNTSDTDRNGTALLLRLESSDSAGTKDMMSGQMKSYRHRSEKITNSPAKLDVSLSNYHPTTIKTKKSKDYLRSKDPHRVFTIRRPWSSSRQIATSRGNSKKPSRATKTIYTGHLPIKTKHEPKEWITLSSQDEDSTTNLPVAPKSIKPTPGSNKKLEDSELNDLEKDILDILVLEKKSLEHTIDYQIDNEDDFEKNLQKNSDTLVTFAKNAIPLPMKNSINNGGSGPNNIETDMEAVIDGGGTWTMIPKYPTTDSPTGGSPLENFIEQEKMNVADISDLNTHLPILVDDRSTLSNIRNEVEGNAKAKFDLSKNDSTRKSILTIDSKTSNIEQKTNDNLWPFIRHRRLFGTRIEDGKSLNDNDKKAKWIDILRNPQKSTHCDLTLACKQLYSEEKYNCESPASSIFIPDITKKLRFSKCSSTLSPENQELKQLTKTLDEKILNCLQTTQGTKIATCSDDIPSLPHFDHLSECANRLLYLNLHCEKLSACCTASSQCHRSVSTSDVYAEIKKKKQELFKKSQECQLKSFQTYKQLPNE